MHKYTRKPEQASRTFAGEPKASRQADLSTLLQPKTVSSRQPVQRYTEIDGYRIADDQKAAVKVETNNKFLYASQDRILDSNQILNRKRMPIELNPGAANPDLETDNELFTVTPKIKEQPSNLIPPALSPQADPATQEVLLPSECEKGAIAIIGALTKTRRSAGNIYQYEDKKHELARLGELLSRSTASPARKEAWYGNWSNLKNAVNIAEGSMNSCNFPKNSIDWMFTMLDTPELKNRFGQQFKCSPDASSYRTEKPDETIKALFSVIMHTLDTKINELEIEVMCTVDTGTAGAQRELITAQQLKAVLTDFFNRKNYNKLIIDRAINMVPERSILQALLNSSFRADPAGLQYVPTTGTAKEEQLRILAETVLTHIHKYVTALTARNITSLHTGSGLNTEVNPGIGQSYGILGGQYDVYKDGRWNWHWAAVIMKTETDNITMEAHADYRQGEDDLLNNRWDFRMYGTRADSNQTFYDEWKPQGFGKAPIGVLGVLRDRPHAAKQVDQAGITGLNPPEIETAISCASACYDFLRQLTNGTTKERLISDYGEGPLLDQIPESYRIDLQNDLTALSTAISALRESGDRDGTTLQPIIISIQTHASTLQKKIVTFCRFARHYQGHTLKQEGF